MLMRTCKQWSGPLWLSGLFVLAVIASGLSAAGQAGRRAHSANEGSTVLNIVATRDDRPGEPITGKQIALYDNGVEQAIKSFSVDPSPARMVLLVDNSLSIRADVEKLEEATREFAYEIYEGDKLLIVGYDNQAEIVADWTDDAKQIEKSLKSFRKQGDPHLFDALSAVAEEALRPLSGQKRVIVVISDGLDRGSKTKFNQALSVLQEMDIAVYAVQAPDRTRGAMRRDQPKPVQVIDQLATGTGGRVFSIDEPRVAAKSICDELRKNRYVLAYAASGIPFGEVRPILVVGNTGINVRSKTAQPPN
jgi:Ca-activated chloride channel homolog